MTGDHSTTEPPLFPALEVGAVLVQVQVGDALDTFPQLSFPYTVFVVGHAGSVCVPTRQFTVDENVQ